MDPCEGLNLMLAFALIWLIGHFDLMPDVSLDILLLLEPLTWF